jgi:hypothetical protein
MKQESIEVILFLLQSKKPKRIDQIHRALLSNSDYERRYQSYKKDGGRILRRILDNLILSPYFEVSKNAEGETVYSSYQTLSNLQSVNQVQFIGPNAANDDDIELSNNLIQSLINQNLADQTLLNQMAYINDHDYSALQQIISALQSESYIEIHTSSEVLYKAKPVYVAVKSLKIEIDFDQNNACFSLPLSDVKVIFPQFRRHLTCL